MYAHKFLKHPNQIHTFRVGFRIRIHVHELSWGHVNIDIINLLYEERINRVR